jgi:hypothetical protein
MKHITFADKNLLTGDAVADLIIEYAVLLARRGDADSITINAYGGDGNEVVATLLLDQGASAVAETAQNSLPEPGNEEAETYMRDRIAALVRPSTAQAVHASDVDDAIEEIEKGYGRDGSL